MKGAEGKKRLSRIRHLSREELALWRHVTADVKPRVAKLAAPATPEAPAPTPPEKAELGSLIDKFSRAADLPIAIETKKPAPPALPPLAPLERRLKRHLSSGRAQVDDIIDLHGMTQAQAHLALNAFILRAASSGARIVLVITGKGAPDDRGDFHASERGVLRRQTPHWLKAPALRTLVLSIEEAGRPHGGGGALYVRLRRRAAPQ